jgi:hypothetical protein
VEFKLEKKKLKEITIIFFFLGKKLQYLLKKNHYAILLLKIPFKYLIFFFHEYKQISDSMVSIGANGPLGRTSSGDLPT